MFGLKLLAVLVLCQTLDVLHAQWGNVGRWNTFGRRQPCYPRITKGICTLIPDPDEDPNVKGTIEFVQTTSCTQWAPQMMQVNVDADGFGNTVNGIRLNIHNNGDLSDGCGPRVGDVFNPYTQPQWGVSLSPLGQLNEGSSISVSSGRAVFDFMQNRASLTGTSSILGRSVVVTDSTDNDRLACCVIGRMPDESMAPMTGTGTMTGTMGNMGGGGFFQNLFGNISGGITGGLQNLGNFFGNIFG